MSRDTAHHSPRDGNSRDLGSLTPDAIRACNWSIVDTAAILGVSRRTIYRIFDGDYGDYGDDGLKSVYIGTRRLLTGESIDRFKRRLQNQPAEAA